MVESNRVEEFKIPQWYFFLFILEQNWLKIDLSDFFGLSKTQEFKDILEDLLDRVFNRLENMEFAEFIKSIILWTLNLSDYSISSLEEYKKELRNPKYFSDATFSLRLGFTKQIRFSLFWNDESDIVAKNIKDSLSMLSNLFIINNFEIDPKTFFDLLEQSIDEIIKQKRKSTTWELYTVLSS